MVKLLMIHPNDDVAVATETIKEGDYGTYAVAGNEVMIEAVDEIPKYHKIAVRNVEKGHNVIKYGEVIGYALKEIQVGEHVHTHNLSDLRRTEDE